MAQIKFSDLYRRNAKGVLSFFPEPQVFKYAFLPLLLTHFLLLPLTTTLGAALKTLFDLKTRKEFSDDQIGAINKKIEALNTENLTGLVGQITDYNNAQSLSSKMLINELTMLETDTEKALRNGPEETKRTLQESQLNPEGKIDVRKTYKDQYIANLVLDGDHQKRLDDYTKRNSEQCQKTQLEEQKRIIKDYMSAPHNNGKKMQQLISSLFHDSSAMLAKAPQPVKKVEPLPFDIDSMKSSFT